MSDSFSDEIHSQVERWEKDQGTDAAWDARRLIDQLSKAKQHQLAVEHANRALEIWNDFEPLSSAVAWVLYRKDLAEVSEESNLEQRRLAKHSLDKIKNLCEKEPYGTYSAWPPSALKFTAALAKRWPNAALDILKQLDQKKLNGQRKEKFPSDRERWFMQTTKALDSSGQWEELLRTCTAAQGEACIDDKNQKWISLRLAEALRFLNRIDEAEPIIARLTKDLGDWWLYARWAKVLAQMGRSQEALNAAYRALSAGGASSFGWETLGLVGELLEKSDQELAVAHVRLSRAFRQQEGWPANKPLEELAKRLGISEQDEASISELKKILQQNWRQTEDSKRETGTVIKHINEGAGFIAPDSGGDAIFFSVPMNSNKQLPGVESKVSFIRENSFDKKKNRESERATKWKPAS